MAYEEIQQLIGGGESLTVEFKRELSSSRPRDICKEIAALATMQGGHLLVGVDDDGSVPGVSNPKEIIAKIESWVGAYVSPTPQISLAGLPFGNATLVCVRVG